MPFWVPTAVSVLALAALLLISFRPLFRECPHEHGVFFPCCWRRFLLSDPELQQLYQKIADYVYARRRDQ